jgi:hypothetical protein
MADATGLVSGRGCGQLVDGIPKAIMLCLVNEVKEQMQGALLDVLYKRDESGNMSVENLLEEDADYTRQKKRCQEFLHLVRSIMMRTKERCACVLPGRRRRRRRLCSAVSGSLRDGPCPCLRLCLPRWPVRGAAARLLRAARRN